MAPVRGPGRPPGRRGGGHHRHYAEFAGTWGLPLTYGLIVIWLYRNWKVPGLQVAAVGVSMNILAVLLNEGKMPVWDGALFAAGLTLDDLVGDPFHVVLTALTAGQFVTSGGIFGDVVPIPIPILRDVVSIGDVLLWVGIVWAVVAAMTRPSAFSRRSVALGLSPSRPVPGGEFQLGVAYASTMTLDAEGAMAGGSGPALAGVAAAGGVAGVAGALPAEEEGGQSPYLRLVVNRNFALLWMGQLISLMGDRVHTIALGFLVATRATPLDVGLTFAATAVPNVLLGPVGGRPGGPMGPPADDDRLRPGPRRARPDRAVRDQHQHRPGVRHRLRGGHRGPPVPPLQGRPRAPDRGPRRPGGREQRDQRDRDPGRPGGLPGRGPAGRGPVQHHRCGVRPGLGHVPRVRRAPGLDGGRPLGARGQRAQHRSAVAGREGGVHFLSHQAELRANTLVSTVAQVAVGTEVTCSLLYAKTVLDQTNLGFPQNYALLMAAVGLGSIVGGLLIGGFAGNVRKGPMAIAGFIGMGATFVVAGLVTDPIWAIGIFFLAGVANMAFVIPNITLFQERTPQGMFARVVSSRQALVFGVMAAAMGVSGYLAGIIGPETMLMVGGAVAIFAGLVGLLIPSMRNAR